MNPIRQALSKIGEILVLYLRLLALAIVLYALLYGYLSYFDDADVARNSSDLDSQRSDL